MYRGVIPVQTDGLYKENLRLCIESDMLVLDMYDRTALLDRFVAARVDFSGSATDKLPATLDTLI